MPNFSIIVCTHNGENRILPTLQALVNLKLSDDIKCELIIVDNFSKDKTAILIKNFKNSLNLTFNITLAYEEKIGRSFAIKKALSLAIYDWVIFCDDDNLISENYLFNAANIIQSIDRIGLIGSKSSLPQFNINIPKWLESNFHMYAIGNQGGYSDGQSGDLDFIWGAGMIGRKIIFDLIYKSGLDLFTGKTNSINYLGGEDYELCLIARKLGYKLWYSSELNLVHNIDERRISWMQFKTLNVRNSLPWVYLNMYFKWVLTDDDNFSLKEIQKYLSVCKYRCLTKILISLIKKIAGFFLFAKKGYSYQTLFELSIAEYTELSWMQKNTEYLYSQLLLRKNLHVKSVK